MLNTDVGHGARLKCHCSSDLYGYQTIGKQEEIEEAFEQYQIGSIANAETNYLE
jgi:hypothetical protein